MTTFGSGFTFGYSPFFNFNLSSLNFFGSLLFTTSSDGADESPGFEVFGLLVLFLRPLWPGTLGISVSEWVASLLSGTAVEGRPGFYFGFRICLFGAAGKSFFIIFGFLRSSLRFFGFGYTTYLTGSG